TYQSGDYTAEQHIRKRGNPLARKVLYRTVINIISASSYRPTRFNDFYQMKKQSFQSKGTKKIAVTVMSRLNRTIFHLVLNNEGYEPTVSQPRQ
ncbi:transposase, partial [Lacticaseibacillus paracasei]